MSCADAVNTRQPHVGASLLAKAVDQFAMMLAEPTPSRASPLPQVFCVVWGCCEHPPAPCGSEPARESGGSVCCDVGCADAFASKLAPTMGSEYERESQAGCKAASRASFAPTDSAQADLMGVRPGEPGRLLGRLALDVDLGAPLTTLAERRHCGVGIPAWMPG